MTDKPNLTPETRDQNANPDNLMKLANIILRGFPLQEIAVAEVLRLCAVTWRADILSIDRSEAIIDYLEGSRPDDPRAAADRKRLETLETTGAELIAALAVDMGDAPVSMRVAKAVLDHRAALAAGEEKT